MSASHHLDALIEALRRLPGVGAKSASRMAFHLLSHDREGAQRIAQALVQACQDVRQCELCNTLTDTPICQTCADPRRDRSQLCVVETPADQAALERTQAYNGLYFVLMGRLSPLDGIGPKDIGLAQLLARVKDNDEQEGHAQQSEGLADAGWGKDHQRYPAVREVILATNFTAEGEATAHVIAQTLKARGVNVTRLARGVPVGSELEYVDLGTIAHALSDRR